MVVLYEGQQIYFGRTGDAKQFFTDMGFVCPPRQTTADFLTSLTSPSERRVKPGYEDKVPRTPAEFAQRWRNSAACASLLQEIDTFDQEYPIGGDAFKQFGEARRLMQSKQQSVSLFVLRWGLSTISNIVSYIGVLGPLTPFRFMSRLCFV